jgi:hypothetical protein
MRLVGRVVFTVGGNLEGMAYLWHSHVLDSTGKKHNTWELTSLTNSFWFNANCSPKSLWSRDE